MSKIFVADKLKIQGTKTLSTIALILILTFSAFMAAMPAANAHTPAWTVATYPYISVIPDPVGVGQSVFVNFWLDKVPPTATGPYGDRWHNMTVTVTKPDGTTQILGPFSSDAVGGAFTTFTPTTTGSYTFQFSFPGQTIVGENPGKTGTAIGTYNPAYIGDYYQPSISAKEVLTVQQQQIQSFPLQPLPTGYWQRPIFAMNRNWYAISGNWLGVGTTGGKYNANENFNPYATAPNSAHIVWTRPEGVGGLIGGEFGNSGSSNYYSPASQYETKYAPVVINGILYYTSFPGASTSPEGWFAVDLRTGQTIWTKNYTIPLAFGQIYNILDINQYGAIPYLWATGVWTTFTNIGAPSPPTYSMYDAFTGNWILNIANMTSGTWDEAADGTMLDYYVNATSNTLNMWNSTLCITQGSASKLTYTVLTPEEVWRPPQGYTIDFAPGIQWSKPLVTQMTATNGSNVPINPTLSISKIASGVILMTSVPLVSGYSWQAGWQTEAGYSQDTGQLLWGPINRTETPWTRVTVSTALDGVYTEFNYESLSQTGYSLTTGQKLWGPTATNINDTFGYYVASSIAAYGRIYTSDLGGYVYCWDKTTGAPLWTFYTGSSGFETVYGSYPVVNILGIADGKLYVLGGHEYNPPLFLGSQLWCINATSGQKIWSTYGFATQNAGSCSIADGYLTVLSGYDNQIYCYGMGQSATTVSASPITVANGGTTTIQGTVTDQSPGQTCLGIPAAGTPAISDASMSQWMEYLYMQQPKPMNATGVPVTLTAFDPNGNTENIGTVTSDMKGNYAIAWTPPVPGVYKITATFAGSDSYFGSDAETAISVAKAPAAQVPAATPAPTATPSPTVTPITSPSPQVTATPVPAPSSPSLPTTYIIIAVVAIIVVVAAAALVLRRRK